MPVPALFAVLAGEDAPAGLDAAVARLAERYHLGVDGDRPARRDDLDLAAYVLTRMPATSAAMGAALDAGHRALADCRTLLDLGTGPGSVLWAAVERLPLSAITAVDRDGAMMDAGRRLAAAGASPLPAAVWLDADLRALPPLATHDLVTVSYALGELDAAEQGLLVERAWELAGGALVLVEPGTPRGAAAVLAARTRLIRAGAHLAAPCTHAGACPLSQDGRDSGWCHQTVRLPRSRVHRAAKSGSLGYEDEPFSYLVASRRPVALAEGRILEPPRSCRHAIELTLCTVRGLECRTVTRREAEAWATARHVRWGSTW